MQVVYTHELAPESYSKSIFLAGPTPRSDNPVPSWRTEALRILEEMEFDGVVFVPESREGGWSKDYHAQVEWEEEHLHLADVVLFWVPRDMASLPGLTTNDEWGAWKRSGKCVWGAPEEAVKTRYQSYYAEKFGVPQGRTLMETLERAVEVLGEGAERAKGERYVPLYLWKTASFQGWYRVMREAGNHLQWARLEWVFRAGKKKDVVFCWALHVHVYIASEGRVKSNEFILSRPDIATVLLYEPGREEWMDTKVVLVREFRSPGRAADGFVRELPGGTTFKGTTDLLQVAAEEVEEEVGFSIEPSRLVRHLPRQMAATFSTHQAHLFSARVTHREMAQIRSLEGVARGVAEDSERTYVEVRTVRELMESPDVDWATLGMILSIVKN